MGATCKTCRWRGEKPTWKLRRLNASGNTEPVFECLRRCQGQLRVVLPAELDEHTCCDWKPREGEDVEL